MNAHTRMSSRVEIDGLANNTNAAIYTISRNFTGISALAPGEGEARASLDEFTQRTGGRHFVMDNTTEVRDLAMRISADLRTSYVLGFQSQDKALRTIRLRYRSAVQNFSSYGRDIAPHS